MTHSTESRDVLRAELARHNAGGYFFTSSGHRECYCGHVLTTGESWESHVTDALLASGAVVVADKPPEPTGLGAVVEDTEGRRWIRNCGCVVEAEWVGPHAFDAPRKYVDISAARVLSDGVARVHNHPPYRPVCNERRLPDGQLRGACLKDDGASAIPPERSADA